MKIKELVELLKKYDPEHTIKIEVKFPENFDYNYSVDWYVFDVVTVDNGWEPSGLITIFGNDPEIV